MKYLKNPKVILLTIILLGGFLRFYKLDWSNGLYAHPDEYHIVISVNQLAFPTQTHPHFFSYGTVIIYLIYFTKAFLESISATPNPFLIGRFYSALFSTLTILNVYFISKLVLEKKYALIAAFLAAITPGLIQQSHFATPESILIFFISATLLFILLFLKHTQLKYLLFASMFLGLGVGTKITSSLILPAIFFGLFLRFLKTPLKLFLYLLISLLISFITFSITSPFVLLDFQSFRSSFNYESGVARGTSVVFYTRQFINTFPVLFQIEKILPFALSIPLLVFGTIGFFLIPFSLLKRFKLELFIIFLTFLFLFIPNSFLFAKWTRFIAPTFPFFVIFTSFSLYHFNNKFHFLNSFLTNTVLISTSIFTLMFFSIYLRNDIRITANAWIKQYLPANSNYLVEGGNTVDLPLSTSSKISIDFYSLEENAQTRKKIAEALTKSDYFIVQSRRVFLNHQRLPNLYPKTANFYSALFSGQLGFEQIKELHSYPLIPLPGASIEFPDEEAEETWSVFDHPVIRIFQKRVGLREEDYAKIIEQI